MDELEIQIEDKYDKTMEANKIIVSLYYNDIRIDSDWIYKDN